jgi:integrase
VSHEIRHVLVALDDHGYGTWGLRGVKVKGSKTRDIPLPGAVMKFLQTYVGRVLGSVDPIGPETPLFWSTWGRRVVGKTRAPMTGKNIWRLCKVYGRIIGYPELKPHDLRHGVSWRWRCWSSITISSRCARCSGISTSIQRTSTPAFDRHS